MILSQFLSFFFPVSFAVDPSCNYLQNMVPGVTYYVYNKEYPGNYMTKQNCRWIAIAPSGYEIETNCQVEIPQSPNCNDDRLLISLNGDENLKSPDIFCGYGNTSLQSNGSKISIGLITASNTSGGRFLCAIQTREIGPSCDCGWQSSIKIVGGTETGVNEFPMMAGLVDFDLIDLFCGATIIAPQYALTAAHCLKNKQPRTTGLLVGDHNISSGVETDSARLVPLLEFKLHEMYNDNDPKAVNDIAVVRTTAPIEFTPKVGPACLPIRQAMNSFENEVVQALGWGTTEFTGPKSEVLLKTDLNVLSYQNCYAATDGTVSQICTFYPGHDACQSDSGGPLMWKSTRLFVLGIISSGYGCASSRPALSTRVTYYLDWIRTNTPGTTYCIK